MHTIPSCLHPLLVVQSKDPTLSVNDPTVAYKLGMSIPITTTSDIPITSDILSAQEHCIATLAHLAYLVEQPLSC
jgi:hypothetical protein